MICQEAIEKHIKLPDDKPYVVQRMLSFCYMMDYSDQQDGTEPGFISQSLTNAEVYVLADKFGMSGLKQAAETKFSTSMTKFIDSNDNNPEASQKQWRLFIPTRQHRTAI